ncbi:MAG: hypothetical protein ABEI98_02475 [Halorhabdus sp.]
MRRRTLLVAGASVGLGLLAGCGETQPTETDTQAADREPTEMTTEPVDRTTTAPTTTTEPTSTITTQSDESPTDEDPGPTFGTLFAFEDSYAVEGTFSDPESGTTGRMTGRHHGRDVYQRIELAETGDSFELYVIDDDEYVVLNDETCFLNPGTSMRPDASVDGDAKEYGDIADPDIRPSGATRIDGMRVQVFEVTSQDVDEPITLYVSASTGYLRRVETETVRLDYHRWGDVDPISPPEMDCRTFPA